ncbi:MAG: NAD(P)H-binding protein [Candidatus Dormiibacterota bacterium]
MVRATHGSELKLRVALFGATGFVGSAVLEELLRDGHQVAALVRTPDPAATRPGLTVIAGDVGDPAAVARVVSGAEAVISCLGTRRNENQPLDFLASATRNIIGAMKQGQMERLVAISGAGIAIPGERKPFPHNAISALLRLLARDVVAAKQHEFAALKESAGIAWTAVRPTRVVNGPATDRLRVGVDPGKMGMQVTRGDLARFMVGQLTDQTYFLRAPFVSS